MRDVPDSPRDIPCPACGAKKARACLKKPPSGPGRMAIGSKRTKKKVCGEYFCTPRHQEYLALRSS